MPTNRLVIKEQIATYASLLFEAVKNEGGSEGVLRACNEAKQIVAAIRGNADLESVLKDPGYDPEQKAEIARNVFAGASPALVSVIALMAERGEIDYLSRVADGIEERMNSELGMIVVDVTTAVELDDHLRDLIKKKAGSETGKTIVLNEHVDKSILGGIIMSTKDERLDASLLTQVEKTREALKK